jgi:hypothetical protein
MTHLIQRVELFCKGGKVIRQLNVRVFLQNQNQIYPKTVVTYRHQLILKLGSIHSRQPGDDGRYLS